MKYRELIQFEPLETTIQLVHANERDRAEQLVSSYVISNEMADRLVNIVLPQIQFEEPADNKGLLIVGNYGTGKSHLMSVISAIAEYADLASALKNTQVAEAAQAIAGKFKVFRTELNTEAGLRDILCQEIESYLESIGVSYRFPSADQIPNNKGALADMMAAFEEKYPAQGLLLVVDELLDYLRSRMGRGDAAIILDLNFLRELGEVARDLRFRFVAGIQVSLFDNPQFQFVADSLRRVKDRFEQIYIARTDVKYVVAERLLGKTADKLVKVQEHLKPFTKFYGDMNERLDEFVRLFPIHPDYIDVFERLTVVEKRQIMRSLSQAMQRVLDQDVPTTEPGLIAFDSYWQTLQEDASFRTIPDVSQVIECNTKLESIVNLNYPKGKNKPFAVRIIRGLSVFRLAVGDIETRVGLTAESLRDQLCLYDPMVAELGGNPAEDLRGAIETALRLISSTVNGQFISATERDSRGRLGGQFYLDVKKTVDYDAQIEKRMTTLGDDILDRYYFNALKQLIIEIDQPVVPGYQIWQHELEWRDRRASRLGYLLFGIPNERSTAQPPRDFYLFFLPRFRTEDIKDGRKSDEVFFRLTGIDDSFYQTLKRYAAALDLESTASGEAKNVYSKEAASLLQNLQNWLRDNIMTAYDVTYGGVTKRLLEWAKGKLTFTGGARDNVQEILNSLSAFCLAPHFEEQAPEYPRFSVLVTQKSRELYAQDALKGIASANRTKQAIAVLDALKLLDGDQLVPSQSTYANYILNLLRQKGQGQVLNRSEVLQEENPDVEYMALGQYRLEPEWVVVLIAALVREFNYTLTIPGKTFNAMNLGELVNTSVGDLVDFQHIKAPKDYDIEALKALYAVLGLQTGMGVAITQGGKTADTAIQQLQTAIGELTQKLVMARQALQGKLSLLGRPLLTEQEQTAYRSQLDTTKAFLESLQAYNSAGKLKNFRYEATEVYSQQTGLDRLREVEALQQLVTDLGATASYLSQAELVLPPDHSWVGQMRSQRDEVLAEINSPAKRNASEFSQQIAQRLAQLKQEYINAYMVLHTQARLGGSEDRRKAELIGDRRLQQLNQLAAVRGMHVSQLNKFQDQLAGLKSCFALTESELQGVPVCPHCGFKPSDPKEREAIERPAAERLAALDAELNQLVTNWTQQLLGELTEDPTVQSNLTYLSTKRKKLVEGFRQSQALPEQASKEFIDALNEVLSNLNPVTITTANLASALLAGGSPITPDEMEQRFKDYLGELTKGKDRKSVRIILEQEQ